MKKTLLILLPIIAITILFFILNSSGKNSENENFDSGDAIVISSLSQNEINSYGIKPMFGSGRKAKSEEIEMIHNKKNLAINKENYKEQELFLYMVILDKKQFTLLKKHQQVFSILPIKLENQKAN